MKLEVVVLALVASSFTAMASVAQRKAAAPAPEHLALKLRLISYLLRRPVWFAGILCMIAGFLFQVEALRVGSLTLVQPLIATELVLVFGVLAVQDRHRVGWRDWIAAIGMVVGLGGFLALARPSGGAGHAPGSLWVLAAASTLGFVALTTGAAFVPGWKKRRPTSGRKAALLGVAAATGFGFVAAVIKELSSHLSQGPAGVLLNWSPYVLLLSGAVAFFLASNAFQAGSLAASQPGLTIVDPLVASLLGVILFGERINHHPLALVGELLALSALIGSVLLLSRSPLVQAEGPTPASGSSGLSVAATAIEAQPAQDRPSVQTPRAGMPSAPSSGEAEWQEAHPTLTMSRSGEDGGATNEGRWAPER